MTMWLVKKVGEGNYVKGVGIINRLISEKNWTLENFCDALQCEAAQARGVERRIDKRFRRKCKKCKEVFEFRDIVSGNCPECRIPAAKRFKIRQKTNVKEFDDIRGILQFTSMPFPNPPKVLKHRGFAICQG